MTLAATLVVYGGVIWCFFWADDIVYLYDARNGEPLEFLLTPYGGHLSWVRNLLFLVLERLVGPRPEPFFFVVLATRLVNVALFFAVVRTWTGSALLAVVWATLWGTSQRNAVTLSWFAGHGQMIVGTVMLILLWRAAALTVRGAELTTRDVWGAVALSVVAAGSFGIGLGMGLVVPISALLLFPRTSWCRRWGLLSLVGLLPLLYGLGLALNALVGWRSFAPGTPSTLAAATVALEVTALLIGNALAGLLAGFTLTAPISIPGATALGSGFALILAGALAVADGPSRRRLLAGAGGGCARLGSWDLATRRPCVGG